MTSASLRLFEPSPETVEALAAGDKAHLRAIALEYVRRCREYGTTVDQACEALGMGHNSLAPRLTERQQEGLVVKLYDANGRRVRRETRQRCQAGVIVAAEVGWLFLDPLSLFGDLSREVYQD